jgi:LSD1 subclass zinc finger protein
MLENLPTTLNCPACGAPLDFDGESTVVRCSYCRNTSRLPPDENAALARKLAPVRVLIRDGDLIGAIKKFREIFGVGLKDAKGAVEALRDGRPIGS